jgi:small redox-active disulfide protein 2
MLSIKILGSGCTNCKRLEQITRKMVESMATETEIIKVTDYADIMSFDILSTPGLVINEKVVSNGRIPSEGEISTFLVNAMVGV